MTTLGQRVSQRAPAPAVAGRRHVVTCKAVVAEPPTTSKPGPIIIDGQVLHSLTPERLALLKTMGPFVEAEVYPLLKHSEKCWQPSDFLPPSEDPYFMDQVMELRKRTANLPDEYIVTFVGDMITEEALPTYMAMLNTLDGVRDETGASQTPWAKWTREWTAEENRHGDVMNKYMYLTGRCNTRAIDVTIQNLICTGMDPKTENNPYLGFLYTSFQERATKVSHGNTARHALGYGDELLAKMCGSIASDEGRHEIAYQRIFEKLYELDPDGAVLAFADMMRKQITMPAHMMDDGEHAANNNGRSLFADFSATAERIGVYTAFDYANIMEFLIKKFKVADRHHESGDAAAAQDYLMKMPDRVRKLAERTAARKSAKPDVKAQFSWVFNRPVSI